MLRYALAALPFALGSSLALAGAQYTLSPLGYIPDGEGTVPTLVGTSQIVGFDVVGQPATMTPFFLSANTPAPFVTPPPNSVFSPQAINSSGTIAGFLMADSSGLVAPFYSAAVYQNGQYVQLQPPGPNPISDFRASGINGSGEIAGYIRESDSRVRAIAWTNGQPAFLDLNPTDSSGANAIDDQGWIAGGIIPLSANASTPVIWRNGVMTSIPLPANATSGTAITINNAGQVLVTYFALDGNASTGSQYGEDSLLLWQNGVETLLPQFSDPAFGTFTDSMNDSGDIAGYSGGRAVLWHDGQIYDLNDLIAPDSGWLLLDATSINDADDIVGYGTYGGMEMPFLLTPTGNGFFSSSGLPEPASLALLALGSAALFRRRK